MLSQAAQRLKTLPPWPRRSVTVGLGALLALAFPPYHLLPLAVISMTGLIWLLDAAPSPKRAFFVGWQFGAGFMMAGLFWVAEAFLVDVARHGWMIPFALPLLGVGMGLFVAASCALAKKFWSSGPERILVLALAWAFFEWVRTWIFTGFPWNLLGTIWAFEPMMMQSAALWGTIGLSLLTLAMLASPALLADDGGRVRRWGGLGVSGLCLVGLAGGGLVYMANGATGLVPGVTLRLVQPNIAQKDKWDPALRQGFLNQLIGQSKGAADITAPGVSGPPTLVIWPETSAYYSLDRIAGARGFLAEAAPKGGYLIAGAPRTTGQGVKPFQLWNSLFVLSDTGVLAGQYDKSHLVPFGEYAPLRDILPLGKLAVGAVDYSPGPGPVVLSPPSIPPFSPLICYEAIFPGKAKPSQSQDFKRPQWLLNITNDAWFGSSAGPWQHLAAARYRAVEEGLPLVRVAGTGISMVSDAHGRILAQLELNQLGVLDAPLPQPVGVYTPFGQLGHLASLLLSIFMFLISYLLHRLYR